MCALPARRIGNLVMVLNEIDHCLPRQTEGRGAAPFLLPAVALALIQIAVLTSGYKLLRATQIVGVVRLIVPRQCDEGRMMKIVVPQPIEAKAALIRRSD